MSNIFLIALLAIIPAIIIVLLSKRYNWDEKIFYNLIIVIIGFIGVIVFSYALILHFNIIFLIINIFLLFGIILKILKIREILKRTSSKKE